MLKGEAQSIDNFYIIGRHKDNTPRHDAVCRQCRVNRQSEARRIRHGTADPPSWVKNIYSGLRQTKNTLDPALTPEVLTAIMDLQHQTCTITGLSILLPEEPHIDYPAWKSRLTDKERLLLPRLVSILHEDTYRVGTVFFIVESVYPLYSLLGVQGLISKQFSTPVIHQKEAILKEIYK